MNKKDEQLFYKINLELPRSVAEHSLREFEKYRFSRHLSLSTDIDFEAWSVAFKKGFDTATVILDAKKQFNTQGGDKK